jgi:hypothetical protein
VSLLGRLLGSPEPSIRLEIRLGVEEAKDAEVTELREQVCGSARVAALLSERGADGRIDAHPYQKWSGAHWVLVTLAELGYPAEDETLIPLREQTLAWLFSDSYLSTLGKVHGLPRLHASIEGNAVWAMLTLGLADERADALAERLHNRQWPDGGWNCDPEGQRSHLIIYGVTHSHSGLTPARSDPLRYPLCCCGGRGQ